MSPYLPLSDQALILDNSGEQEKIIAIKNKNRPIDVVDEAVWEKMQKGQGDCMINCLKRKTGSAAREDWPGCARYMIFILPILPTFVDLVYPASSL